MGLAIGAIEAGHVRRGCPYSRSMNGYSNVAHRRHRSASVGAHRWSRPDEAALRPGPVRLQQFAYTFTRHMAEYGVKSEDLAAIKVAHSIHASNNPKALMKHRVTVDDVINSRWIIRPVAHLLDCCLETDNATCVIVTSAERARDLKHKPIYIKGVQGRGTKPGGDFHYQHGPISRVAGHYIAPRIFRPGRREARGRGHHRLLRRLHLHRAAAIRGLWMVREG